MRYFLLEQDKGYTDIPVPLGWYEILAPGKAMESLKKLPRRTIFKIKTGENTVFLDFMTDPVVMVSEKVKECLELYEPNIPFKEIVLLDRRKKMSRGYFVPFLTELKAVFTVKGPQKLNIAVRLDAAESLLRRSVKGLMFKEMEVKT